MTRQSRQFRSESVESENYLLAAARYIHHNPVRAQIVGSPAQYPWSSYGAYLGDRRLKAGLVDKNELLGLFSDEKDRAVKLFKEYTDALPADTPHDEAEETAGVRLVRSLIQRFTQANKLDLELRDIVSDKELRKELVRELKAHPDLSARQIANVIGVDRNMVQRIK